MTDCICGEIYARHCPVHNEPHYIDFGDPASFWQSLSPEQALALLRAAPKVAGPWVHASTDPAYGAQRSGPKGKAAATVCGRMFGAMGSDARTWITYQSEGALTANDGRSPTLESAKSAADAALLAAGWTLVPAEEG